MLFLYGHTTAADSVLYLFVGYSLNIPNEVLIQPLNHWRASRGLSLRIGCAIVHHRGRHVGGGQRQQQRHHPVK